MNCKNCGRPLDPGARFCPDCGTAAYVQPPINAAPSVNIPPNGAAGAGWGGERFVTKNVMLCPDGKYRWFYRMSLYRNPTIFLLIWKIFFFIVFGIFAFISIIDVCGKGFDRVLLLDNLKVMGIALAVMTAIVSLSYLIYAMMMGGYYFVRFEMDENGVNHAQMPEQAKKARKLGQFTALAGAASGNLSMMGLGMNTAAVTEMYSEFSRVKKIRCFPRRELIKVNHTLRHNQVYAEKEDFEFVSNFILSHCPNAKK